MESKDGERQLICESCGASFGCYPAAEGGCWCGSVIIPEGRREDLKAKFADCICPACLAKFEKEPSAQA